MLSVTGHLGGALTHGEDFLSQPLLSMFGFAPVKEVRKPIININEALVYKDIIEPVLEQKCVQCHNSQKQKGSLRLDTPELLLKGGGVKRGISYGKIDEFGYNIIKAPVHIHDLQATIMHLMGIDHEQLTFKFHGRRYRLTDVAEKVVKPILN